MLLFRALALGDFVFQFLQVFAPTETFRKHCGHAIGDRDIRRGEGFRRLRRKRERAVDKGHVDHRADLILVALVDPLALAEVVFGVEIRSVDNRSILPHLDQYRRLRVYAPEANLHRFAAAVFPIGVYLDLPLLDFLLDKVDVASDDIHAQFPQHRTHRPHQTRHIFSVFHLPDLVAYPLFNHYTLNRPNSR